MVNTSLYTEEGAEDNETLSQTAKEKDEKHSQYRVLNYVCVELQGMRDGGGVRNEAQGLEG